MGKGFFHGYKYMKSSLTPMSTVSPSGLDCKWVPGHTGWEIKADISVIVFLLACFHTTKFNGYHSAGFLFLIIILTKNSTKHIELLIGR